MNTNVTAKYNVQSLYCLPLILTCMIVTSIIPAHRMPSLLRAAMMATMTPHANNNQDKNTSKQSNNAAWMLLIDTSWHGKDYRLIPHTSPDDYFVMTKCHQKYNKTSRGMCLNQITKLRYQPTTSTFDKVVTAFYNCNGYSKISDISPEALVPDASAALVDRLERARSIKRLLQQRYGGDVFIHIQHDIPQEPITPLDSIILINRNMGQLTMRLLSDFQGTILCRNKESGHLSSYDIRHDLFDVRENNPMESHVIIDGNQSPHDVIRAMSDIVCTRIQQRIILQKDSQKRNESALLHITILNRLWHILNKYGNNRVLIFEKWPTQYVVSKDDSITTSCPKDQVIQSSSDNTFRNNALQNTK